MFKSARWRLVAWNALVFGVLLAVLSFAAYEVFNSHIYSGYPPTSPTYEVLMVGA